VPEGASLVVVPVWNQLRTNSERQTSQLNAQTRQCKSGSRRVVKKRYRRHDDTPARNQQKESNQSHENCAYYNNAALRLTL
jgi:hypothetical protein